MQTIIVNYGRQQYMWYLQRVQCSSWNVVHIGIAKFVSYQVIKLINQTHTLGIGWVIMICGSIQQTSPVSADGNL